MTRIWSISQNEHLHTKSIPTIIPTISFQSLFQMYVKVCETIPNIHQAQTA